MVYSRIWISICVGFVWEYMESFDTFMEPQGMEGFWNRMSHHKFQQERNLVMLLNRQCNKGYAADSYNLLNNNWNPLLWQGLKRALSMCSRERLPLKNNVDIIITRVNMSSLNGSSLKDSWILEITQERAAVFEGISDQFTAQPPIVALCIWNFLSLFSM